MEENDELENELPQEEEELTGDAQRFGAAEAVSGMYKNWFLDYASYVILERAVPAVEDGLKPVQRRILHALNEMDDGRFNKVANVIGATMQYHPHGDAAIGDALVNMGQKELLFDTQGNWGDVRTGDRAAAARYIEVRLSAFSKDVVFNPKTTEWQLSYDGRKKEPVTLPVKFPLLLTQGVEGIAVGLSTKIMPHNFIELCKASINLLKGKSVTLMPDFPTGGLADFSQYNDGRKGSRIRCRATIEEKDKNTLLITQIPFGTTTASLIESIIKANDKGKIKIKKVIDNTAADVEIEVQVANTVNNDQVIDALYAFTDCELSISPLCCVIVDNKPEFLGVTDILKINTQNTMHLLRRELNIKLGELENKWHFSSLEKIFIENRIYRDIEECETWEAVIEAIDKGLKPFTKHLKREVTEEDIVRLTEIKIKRISKFDAFKADELIRSLEDEISETKAYLENLVDYTIAHYDNLLKKYGKGRERKTEIGNFGTIEAQVVAAANVKLYANFEEGFVGTSLKKDTFICDCSDLDDIICFTSQGKYSIHKITDKNFVGKDLLHVEVWRKNDDRTTFNLIYYDGQSKRSMVKRFNATSMIRDREYDVTAGAAKSKILYFSANPNGEAEKVTIHLSNMSSARLKSFEYDFSTLAIKGKTSKGNLLTRYPVRKIELKEKGISTLGGIVYWWDEATGRINTDGYGIELGEFFGEDLLLILMKSGEYEITKPEAGRRFTPDNTAIIQKYYANQVINAIYEDGNSEKYYVKRFLIETTTEDKPFSFISEHKKSNLILVTTNSQLEIEVLTENKKKVKDNWLLVPEEFMDVKGWKALGNKLTNDNLKKLTHDGDLVGEPPLAESKNISENVDKSNGQMNLL